MVNPFPINASAFVLLSRSSYDLATKLPVQTAHLTLLLLGLLQDFLHDLLLLNQKRPHNPILYTIRTSRPSVCALNSLLRPGDLGVFARSEGWDL